MTFRNTGALGALLACLALGCGDDADSSANQAGNGGEAGTDLAGAGGSGGQDTEPTLGGSNQEQGGTTAEGGLAEAGSGASGSPGEGGEASDRGGAAQGGEGGRGGAAQGGEGGREEGGTSPGGSPSGGGAVELGGSGASGSPSEGGDAGQAGQAEVVTNPRRIDDVLVNPGMGLANFHFGWWCDLPPVNFTAEECVERTREHWPANHPDSGTAYFRWNWRELEPTQGQIDFAVIDRTIESANAIGETLGFRVMTIADDSIGIPDWLRDITPGTEQPSAGGSTYWPDYRDPTFQAENQRFVAALADRYDGHPGLDHVDIGPVGCWGEWNTACLTDGQGLFDIYEPAGPDEQQEIVEAYQTLIDAYTSSFANTPLVMLGLGGGGDGLETTVFAHAIQNGTGWRVDCWGDWGIFGDSWNHQIDSYPTMIEGASGAYASFPDTWQHAPIQLEVCDTMPGWLERGWTTEAPDGEVYKSFQWALEQHASVLNAKWTEIPGAYLDALDELLVQNGYRIVVDSLRHPGRVAPGGSLHFAATVSNLGVAPSYHARTFTYRLRSGDLTTTFPSTADIRRWLPGSVEVVDDFSVPAEFPSGTYQVDLAILDRPGENPTTNALDPIRLGIAGRRADGWYEVSQVEVE